MPRQTEQSGNPMPDYWSLARQPLSCLVFLTPLLVVYEVGIVLVGSNRSTAVRNGADYWMRTWLEQAGLTQILILPAIVVGFLLAWQLAGRYPWKVGADTLFGMAAESVLFAFVLLAIGQLHETAFRQLATVVPTTVAISPGSAANRMIAFVGAGVYEEVLFRLCLLPAVYGVSRILRMPKAGSAISAIVVTSLLFAIAHYVGPSADSFSLFTFTFRTTAGIFFAALFCARGFGITVGSHAAYDLLVGVLLAGPDMV